MWAMCDKSVEHSTVILRKEMLFMKYIFYIIISLIELQKITFDWVASSLIVLNRTKTMGWMCPSYRFLLFLTYRIVGSVSRKIWHGPQTISLDPEFWIRNKITDKKTGPHNLRLITGSHVSHVILLLTDCQQNVKNRKTYSTWYESHQFWWWMKFHLLWLLFYSALRILIVMK